MYTGTFMGTGAKTRFVRDSKTKPAVHEYVHVFKTKQTSLLRLTTRILKVSKDKTLVKVKLNRTKC